jgi:pSer/pThr/pTyr-binding forkhead associated (FHA) protein
MSSVSTSEALSWLPLRTAPLVPLKCEFCGTPLNPPDGRCPQCEAEPQLGQNVPSRPPDAKLVGISDEREFYITPSRTVTIGRGSTRNEVSLNNPTVSRRHAQIAFEKGRYVLRALEDRNGTFVNNARVRQQTLHDHDEIRFGRASYAFRIVE